MSETQAGAITTGLLVPAATLLTPVGLYYALVKYQRSEALVKKVPWRASLIVVAAIGVLIGMQEAAGNSVPFGGSAARTPEQGDCLKDGSESFAAVNAVLQNAAPATWDGTAADE